VKKENDQIQNKKTKAKNDDSQWMTFSTKNKHRRLSTWSKTGYQTQTGQGIGP
jgi:hypothetical protein